MKTVNVMSFVRTFSPRVENSNVRFFESAKRRLEAMIRLGIENTILIQYDALVDPRYIQLFTENANSKTEYGLWLEIVQPLCEDSGIEWRGRYIWDWHVVPGFSMAYTTQQREMLLDTAMQRFKELFGYYPKTVASWLLDSHSVCYLSEKYHIQAMAICRDQINTDAYTLVGGYFNQGYFPSKKNCFTPAQTEENAVATPMFRLLGPDPVHNYDNAKYIISDDKRHHSNVYTLEPAYPFACDEEFYDWMFRCYYRNEDLGFSYSQVGQETPFCADSVHEGLEKQIKHLIKNYPEVHFRKMCDTGKEFTERYSKNTPATCVWADNDWNRGDNVQSLYYDCKNYMVNLFRCENKVFIRCMYLFDENVAEYYLDKPCETWDALYENLPLSDTRLWKGNDGLVLDTEGSLISVEKTGEGVLTASWDDKKVVFTEDGITISGTKNITFDTTGATADISVLGNEIQYTYKGTPYTLITNCKLSENEHLIQLVADNNEIKLTFVRGNRT